MMKIHQILHTTLLFIYIAATLASEDHKMTPQDYSGPWGEGVQCPYQNPPFPNGTKTYGGKVPSAMTTDAVNYLSNSTAGIFQVSSLKTYTELPDLYFVLRKEFHTWHYSSGKLLTGCWKGVTVYQYLQRP